MKNSKLKGLFAKAKFEIKADKDFINLNEEFFSSVRGGMQNSEWQPLCNIACNDSCNSGCGKTLPPTTTTPQPS